jgi:hypothetical protein
MMIADILLDYDPFVAKIIILKNTINNPPAAVPIV